MFNPNLSEFDIWWDGGMTIAKQIVKFYNDSENFKLTKYESQNDFYDEYLTKFEEFVSLYFSIQQEKNVNYTDDIVINNIRSALNLLKDKGELNFSHFLGAYSQIFYFIDTARKIKALDMIYTFTERKININTTINEIIDIFNIIHKKFYFLVPFTTLTGLYGFNTFLYLFFNKLFPVAASPEPYAVHGGFFQGSTMVMFHDVLHFGDTNKIYHISSKNKLYMDMKKVYIKIIKDKLDIDVKKLLILFLYQYIHERVIEIRCSKEIDVFAPDIIDGLLRIKSVKQQMDENDVNLWLKAKFITNTMREFVIDKMNEAKSFICNKYKVLLQ